MILYDSRVSGLKVAIDILHKLIFITRKVKNWESISYHQQENNINNSGVDVKVSVSFLLVLWVKGRILFERKYYDFQ